jgi:hypothetical protein
MGPGSVPPTGRPLAAAWDNPRIDLHSPVARGRRLGGAAVAMSWADGPVPRRRRPMGPALTTTADASRGAANLLTRPRAGNISSDTRAGASGRSAA